MLNVLREVRVMQQEGKIHSRLLMMLRIMGLACIILGSIVAFETFIGALTPWLVLLLACVGFLIGVYLFSPMNKAEWDEEKELIAAKRMDRIGLAAIGAYVLFVIGLRLFLNQNFHAQVTLLILSLVFGMLLGRIVGTVREIHKAFRLAHP